MTEALHHEHVYIKNVRGSDFRFSACVLYTVKEFPSGEITHLLKMDNTINHMSDPRPPPPPKHRRFQVTKKKHR